MRFRTVAFAAQHAARAKPPAARTVPLAFRTAQLTAPTLPPVAHLTPLAACTALLVACGGDTGGPSSSAEIEDRLLAADFEEVFRVGGIAAEGWAEFTEIADLDFDASGRLYIRDRRGSVNRIVVVDGAGALAAEFGRMGDGPGEFRRVRDMVARPEGGAVIVDGGHLAFMLFGADGSYERAVRFAERDGPGMVGFQQVRHARGEGALFLTRGMGFEMTQGQTNVSTGDRTVYRIPLDEAEEAAPAPFVEGWEPQPPRDFTIETEDFGDVLGAVGDAVTFFEPRLVFDAMQGGGVAYSDSSAYEIKIQVDGAAPRVVGRPLHPQPVTEQLRERARERASEGLEASISVGEVETDDMPAAIREQMEAMIKSMADGMRAMIENAGFMSEVPIVRDLRTTWEGGLWVERWESDPLAQIDAEAGSSDEAGQDAEEAPEGWIDVLAPDGEYLGTFLRADTPMPEAFGPGGLVAFVETDDFDVPTVIVKRVPESVR